MSFSPAAPAPLPAAGWVKENLRAFPSSRVPSNGGGFPFSTDRATADEFLSTSCRLSSPSPSDTGARKRYRLETPFISRGVGFSGKCLVSSPQPPRSPRPIVLIHSPRELLAYRNARPPVYGHPSCADDGRFSHDNGGLSTFPHGSCEAGSPFLRDCSACDAFPSASSLNSSACGSLEGQKCGKITGSPASTVDSVCQGEFAVEFHSADDDDCEAVMRGASKASVLLTPGENMSFEEAGGNPSPSAASLCVSSPGHTALKRSLHDTHLSSKLRSCVSQCQYLRRRRISFVPTLGGLHEGHLHLMRQAACLADEVWVSVFLNPLQFQSGKDFFFYPASIDEDIRLIQQLGVVTVLFVPQRQAMFPLDASPSFPTPLSATSTTASAHRISGADSSNRCEQQNGGSGKARKEARQVSETSGSASAATGAGSPAESRAAGKLEDSRAMTTNGNAGDNVLSEEVAAHQNIGESGSATSTLKASTPSHPEGSAYEKGNRQPNGPSKRARSGDSSRLFRMRVSFESIEDVGGEGRRRPGFFKGIGTVVAQLLTLTRPTYAHFGLKDFQQVACIKRLVCGLGLDTMVVTHSTKREASDGLSLSSRNKRLNEAERSAAAKYYSILQEVCRAYDEGDRRVKQLERVARSQAKAAGLHLYYVTFDRWQDATPVAYLKSSSSVGRKFSYCSSKHDTAAEAVASTLPSSSNTNMRQPPQQEDPTQEQDLTQQQRTVVPVKGEAPGMQPDSQQHQRQPGGVTGEKGGGSGVQQQEDDDDDSDGLCLESPGKYCCTIAVRGNADTTLVDNVTLTDQAKYGDLLPPPLNAPWDRTSAAAKHSFFGSFLLLGSLGMHLRYLDKDDIDVLLQAEEEDTKPRSDGPQLLLPLSCAAQDSAASLMQQRSPPTATEGSARTQPQCGTDATAAVGGVGGEVQQQEPATAHEELCERTGEDVSMLRWLQQQRSAFFERETAGSRKTLRLRKQDKVAAVAAAAAAADAAGAALAGATKAEPAADAAAGADGAAWQSRVGSGSMQPADAHESAELLRNDNSSCQVRALGLFKFDMNGRSSSSTGAAAATTSSSFRRRERLIGYVWAEEEDSGEGRQERPSQGGSASSVDGKTCSTIRVKHVFLKRQRRRQTLGTHLLRAFLAATYKQLVEEQQQAVAGAPLHTQQQQRQQEERVLDRAADGDNAVEKKRGPCAADKEAAARTSRRSTEEQRKVQEGEISETKEKSESKGEIDALCSNSRRQSSVPEQGAEGGKENNSRDVSSRVNVNCMIRLETVPLHLVNVLKEGGFSLEAPPTKSEAEKIYNSGSCSMCASLAQWYNTFVLAANV